MANVYRILRTSLAVVSLAAVTALFIDVTGFAASRLQWAASMQFMPALLALNLGVLAAIVVATLLLGRVYCSVICPLGIYQDIVNRVASLFAGRKKRRLGRFGYSPARTRLRRGILAVFAVLLICGQVAAVCTWAASFVEPYSEFGRMATWLLRPGAVELNNALADAAAARDSYAFAHVSQLPPSLPLIAVAIVTFIVVTAFAATSGRAYCNEICPVGTFLGFLSKRAVLRPVIDLDKCTSCGLCARHCKASCIDSSLHKIDYSRCVSCMDCLDHCSTGALSLGSKTDTEARPAAKDDDASRGTRRALLAGGAIVAGSLVSSALGKHGDGGLAPLKAKKKALREVPVVPPGSGGLRRFAKNCISCQLCVSSCPNGLLSPSTSLSTFMQPVMDFSTGYCRPECTACSDVCPAGAILPLDRAEKSSVKIGTAVVDYSTCISAAYGQSCGRCASGCPAGAIEMIRPDGSRKLHPVVDESACIGCGACEYHCPVGTVASNRSERAAIHVEGVEQHSVI